MFEPVYDSGAFSNDLGPERVILSAEILNKSDPLAEFERPAPASCSILD